MMRWRWINRGWFSGIAVVTTVFAALALFNAGLYGWLANPYHPPVTLATVAPTLAAPPTATPQALHALPYRAIFAGTLADIGWTALGGDWVIKAGALVQQQSAGDDVAISYPGIFERYRLRTVFTHRQGAGAGVLFNMPHSDSVAGAQMVRYDSDGSAVFWGSFDEHGVFNGQGFVRVAAPGTTPHTLEVLSDATSYAVRLDGVTLAQDQPLRSTRGGIGLTVSRAVAAFSSVEALPLETAAPSATELDALHMLSGEWVRQGDAVVQRATDATDYISATGVRTAHYTLTVTIAFPDDAAAPDAGGGVIFQLPSRTSRAGAAMVRLAERGRSIFWGRYDEHGDFIGQGSADLGGLPRTPQTLTLTVRDDSFDIAVDDATIATQIPLQEGTGEIGLLSFRGPVLFRGLSVDDG